MSEISSIQINVIDAITLSGEIHSWKNSKQIISVRGKPRVIRSKQAEADIAIFMPQLLQNREFFASDNYPLHLGFYLYRETKRAYDYINMLQGIQDMLVMAGCIPDDDINHLHPWILGGSHRKGSPAMVISKLKVSNSPLLM
jgi:hypothetical protein